MPDAFRSWGQQLAAQGIVTMRTGALATRHAAQAEAAGLHCIQELALLEARPPLGCADGRRTPPTSACREGRLGDHDFDDMADIDLAAFGPLWRLDASMLRNVCNATPAFRARVVRDPSAHNALLARTRLGRRVPPVGFLVSGRAGRTGYIQRLAVEPDQHRSGVGTALLNDALTWMSRWRADRVLVNTHVENHAALALYRGLGFVDMAERLRVYEGPTQP